MGVELVGEREAVRIMRLKRKWSKIAPHWKLRTTLIALAAAGLASGSLVAATGGAASASSGSKPLVVWVDSARIPNVKAYEKAHPKVKIDLVTYDGDDATGTLQSKFALYNRVGKGWPDVFFSEENYDASSLGDSQYNDLGVLNNGLIPKSVLDKWAPGTLASCTFNGKILCLRNDIGQDVLWVNTALMTKFGYTVPSTWAQWQALGEEVSQQHPGYIVGTVGDTWDDEVYLQASQCPMAELQNAYTVEIDPSSPNCTRVGKLLDPMISDGSVPVANVYAPTFVSQYGAKTLMVIGPSWYGDYLFAGSSGVDPTAGQIAAYPPLTWTTGQAPTTGDVGGGLWFISSHTKQPKLAASMIQWLATNFASQGIAPTFPAYQPDEAPWVAKQVAGGYFANSSTLGTVLEKAAGEIWTGWSPLRFVTDFTFGSTVIPALTGGTSFSAELPAFGTALADAAQVDGYTVVSK
jgi:ABC-type glycerol-3-phosphate transport system substrate-binding protein